MRASLLLRASLAGTALTAPGGGNDLAFRPEAGASLTKAFETTGEFSLDDASIIADGQDISAMIGQLEFSMETRATYEVTDLFKAVAEGRPVELLRTFEVLESVTSMSMTQVPEIPEVNAQSELEGKTVAFRWNAEKGEYELSFHESEGDDELLEGLEEDMDLRLLLPDGEVEVGGSWTIALEALAPLWMPGGNLHMMPEGENADPEAMEMFEGFVDSLGDRFGELLEGECVCTFKGLREEGGARVGEIEIEIEVAGSMDLRELLNQIVETAMAEAPTEIALEFEIATADLAVDYEGTGTLLWDVTAGRLHSLSLNGEVGFGIKLAASIEAMGESHSFDASFEMSGEMLQEVAAKE